MSEPGYISRRALLASGAVAGPAALAGCGPSGQEAAGTGDEVLLTGLLAQLFPHTGLAPAVYSEVARIVRAALAGMPGGEAALAAGRAELGADPAWHTLAPLEKQARLEALEARPWFGVLYRAGLVEFYSHPSVWALLGYPGSSIEFGGYINRGFDEIDWLPGAGE